MQERLEMLGGKLMVESVPGQGSTITATLRRM
jgi:signal transduction histidine kinase